MLLAYWLLEGILNSSLQEILPWQAGLKYSTLQNGISPVQMAVLRKLDITCTALQPMGVIPHFIWAFSHETRGDMLCKQPHAIQLRGGL